MKKYFTIAAMAIMALTSALSFTSCSEQDPITPDVTPSNTPTATTISYYSDGQVRYNSVQATVVLAGKLQTYLNENIGSLCTKVVADTMQMTKDMVRIRVSITAPSKNEKALQAKFIEMQNNDNELNDLVEGTADIVYFSLNVKSYSNGSTAFAYSFSSKYSVVGTWEGTNKAGETVTVEVPGTKDKSGDLLATVYIGTEKYEGTMHVYGNNNLFYSNEMGKDHYGANVNVVRVYLPLDNNTTSEGKLDLLNQRMEKVTFTKK